MVNELNDERKAIDVARTFANYAIVLMHAWAAYQYVAADTCEYSFWHFVCNDMTAAVLPGLFLISGYLLANGMVGATWILWREKLWRRVKRLAVPYTAWNVTFVVFYLLASRLVPRLAQRVSSFGLDTLGGAFNKCISLMTDPIDMPTWFMRTLFIYALLSVFLLPLLRRVNGLIAYGLLGVWFAVTLWLGIGKALKFTYPFYSTLCFVVGMHLSVIGKSPFVIFKAIPWRIVPLVGMAGLAFYYARWHWSYSVMRDISFMLMLPFLFAYSPWFCKFADRLPHWDFLKRSSFFLYTGHFLFCSIALHLFAPLLGSWHASGKLTFLVVEFCTIGVAVNLFFYWLGRKLLRKAFCIWDGSL